MSLHFPDYREIDTPWEPQRINWRYSWAWLPDNSELEEGDVNRAALPESAADPSATHLVREVRTRVTPSNETEQSIETVIEGLAQVDIQFQQLEALTDLRVAPTQWHVFTDEIGRLRTLAKVEIIDGENIRGSNYSWLPHYAEHQALMEQFRQQIDAYRDHAIGPQLTDIDHISQYMSGIRRAERAAPIAHQALWLVDIEPLLY